MSDAVIARLSAACEGVAPAEMLRRLYWDGSALEEGWFAELAEAVAPLDHVGVVHLLDGAGLQPVHGVVALLAFLSRTRAQGEWAHFHITQALNLLVRGGVAEARLPMAVHAAAAAECFAGNEFVGNMAQALVGVATAPWLPREAVRHALLATRMGNAQALGDVAGAVGRLGLLPSHGVFDRTAARQIDEALAAQVGFVDLTGRSADSPAVTSFPVALPNAVTHAVPEGDGHYYQFKRAGAPIPVLPLVVRRVENGAFSVDHTQLGRPGLYTFADGRYLSDLCLGPQPFLAEGAQSIQVDKPLMVVDDVFSGVSNVSHFLFDQLPRLLAYRRLHPGPATLLQCDDSAYYRGALDALGVEDVLRPQELGLPERRFTVRAPVMFLSSNITENFDHPLNSGAARSAALLRAAFNVVGGAKGRRLYVSRADAGSRRAVNAAAVEEVFRHHGFEVVVLGGMSFAEQRAMFAEASHVAGVHGAGLSNVVWSPAECRVFEILPPLVASHTYWMLCGAIGQRYRVMIAEDPELPTPDYREWAHDVGHNNRDVVVDPGRLDRALAEFA